MIDYKYHHIQPGEEILMASFLIQYRLDGYTHNEYFVRVQERLANVWEKQHPINE